MEHIAYEDLHRRFIAPARRSGVRRSTLGSPAQPLFDRLATRLPLTVIGVSVAELETVRDLYGFVLEPAARRACPLVVCTDRPVDALDERTLVDEHMGYAWTIQRLRHVLAAAPATPVSGEPSFGTTLDATQAAAVTAHDGVVQVIAPAGSGKTTVLIERVRELVRRGVLTGQILCTTFNRDARLEMESRLALAGVGDVRAQTFHSVGYTFLREEGLLRHPDTLSLTQGQWRRLCALAQKETGEWIEPPLAAAGVSKVKLGLMMTAAEFRTGHDRSDCQQVTLSVVYELYEQQLVEHGRNDFDDLVFATVRALREHAEIRERWQRRFTHVLVDEYQDIEPAQELLVQLLAAPHDSLFCVGDEDQTLYGWRRASVERIVNLDQVYPGLERVALDTNYRCPPAVIERSRALVEHNERRFPKMIHVADGVVASDPRPLITHSYDKPEEAAWDVARKLAGGKRDDIVVLARTTRLLRIVAEACVPAGVKISAPEAVFESRGPEPLWKPTFDCSAICRRRCPRMC